MKHERADDIVRLSGEIIRTGSKSFAAASRLFDSRTRASVHLLYAWCRHCDDIIDAQDMGLRRVTGSRKDPRQALAELRHRTSAALAGEPAGDPIFAGLQRVAHAHAIPPRHFHELLDGFAMDVDGRRYETLHDTLDYCYHVAGVVGVMMSMIMGARTDETLDRASDLGIAFQLTNIARDTVEDARFGRVYLPRRWLADAGIPAGEVADMRHRREVFEVVARLLAVADGFYDASQAGIARLPLRSAWAVETARVVYRQIGREVLRQGPRAWDARVSTSKARKLSAVGQGALAVGVAKTLGVAPRAERETWTRPKADAACDGNVYELADAKLRVSR